MRSLSQSERNELDEQTEQKLKEIRQLRQYPGVPGHVRDEVDEIIPWRRLRNDARDAPFAAFLSNYVREEHKKRENGDRGPVCHCGDPECPPKNGRVPAQCRGGSGVFGQTCRSNTREYIQSHPTIVVEEAWDAWEDQQSEIHRDLEKARSLLEEHVETSRGSLLS